jgi:hypothetical protein
VISGYCALELGRIYILRRFKETVVPDAQYGIKEDAADDGLRGDWGPLLEGENIP